MLGPGTFLTIALVAGGAALLLGTGVVGSLLLGAILASTDPVVLRDVLRDRRIPRPIRDALSIEAGTNDVVVLPIVLVLIAVADGAGGRRGGVAGLPGAPASCWGRRWASPSGGWGPG